ncbi:aminotransferase class IV [Kitasatospora sp. GP82]|uniref:aminotransferase class IV n=1 Tax=Kitasatospora sp. GP82 TaxID=3035089 RepID=UPI002473BBE2|nr:aminotransferase class IV [Kitasatospora sp. GP82]MDH6123935.1 branched-subunit amino acid aminotransferase/4-amino-4-deoxychorismate lyase [Kitasatospora sp. GP82]
MADQGESGGTAGTGAAAPSGCGRAELNGRPVSEAELRALALTGYGHFTTMCVEDGRVRGLQLHLDRLVRDCRTVFGTELDVERVRAYARRVVPTAGAMVVRVTVFDPALDIGTIGSPAEPQLLVTTRPASGTSPLRPVPPLRVRSVAYRRELPAVKSVGLFGALWQRREAQRAGFDDALFVDGERGISEGGTWNIGFVRGREVVWPNAEHLPGTTMELLRGLYPGRTERVTVAEAAGFEAAFATNAAIGVRAVGGLDSLAFPPGHPVIEELRSRYVALTGDQL